MKNCKYCGKPMPEGANATAKYCSNECRHNAKIEYDRALYYKRSAELAERRKKKVPLSERQKHQSDPNIWNHDYAERQKKKTLEMIGSVLDNA